MLLAREAFERYLGLNEVYRVEAPGWELVPLSEETPEVFLFTM